MHRLLVGYSTAIGIALTKGEGAADSAALSQIVHRQRGGTDTFVLRGFGLEAWEIGPRNLRNLDKLVAAGKLPDGRPVGEYLMHYDSETEQFIPDANAAFLYITREGSLGVIETTDRVTQTADLTGRPSPPPRGVDFFEGVRFNLKTIIP